MSRKLLRPPTNQFANSDSEEEEEDDEEELPDDTATATKDHWRIQLAWSQFCNPRNHGCGAPLHLKGLDLTPERLNALSHKIEHCGSNHPPGPWALVLDATPLAHGFSQGAYDSAFSRLFGKALLPYLERIELRGRQIPVERVPVERLYGPLLQWFYGQRQQQIEPSAAAAAAAVSPAPRNCKIKIARARLFGDDIGRLLGSLDLFSGLEFASCSFDAAFVQSLGAHLQQPKVGFRWCHLDNSMLLAWSRAIASGEKEHSIQVLKLLSFAATAAAVEAGALPNLTALLATQRRSLRELDLGDNLLLLCKSTSRDISSFLQVLSSLENLEVLSLNRCRLCTSVADELLRMLPLSCHELDLSGSGLFHFRQDATSLAKFLDALAKNTSIQKLDLCETGLDDTAVVPLFEALTQNKHLQELSLYRNNFTVCGWEKYLEGIQHLAKLVLPHDGLFRQPRRNSSNRTNAWKRFTQCLQANISLTEISPVPRLNEEDERRAVLARITRRNQGIQHARLIHNSQQGSVPLALWPHALDRLDSNISACFVFLQMGSEHFNWISHLGMTRKRPANISV